ncbi:Fic family protein [Candidatus Saccharibacteria bacterium]|nr:MAG: Fic family protein [Candidatus Saccharibacteria bacterium]
MSYEANKQANTINHEPIGPDSFKSFVESWGVVGDSPSERLQAMLGLGLDGLALFLTDINRCIQGEEETQIHDSTMQVGGVDMVPIKNRYDLFKDFYEQLNLAANNINPERAGDALAMVITTLHPFKEANGRTGRAVSFMLHDLYDDQADYAKNFSYVTASRDQAKAKGLASHELAAPFLKLSSLDLGQNLDLQSFGSVKDYFTRLLSEEDGNLYSGTFGYAALRKE